MSDDVRPPAERVMKTELVNELKGELSGDFEDAVIGMMMPPPEYAAERAHKAMSGIGCDERLLLYVILSNTAKQQDLKAIGKKYKEANKKELTAAMTSETSGVLQKTLINILGGKRSQGSQRSQVKDKDVEGWAKALHGDSENAFKYDVETCTNLFTTWSVPKARAVFAKYKEISGEDVKDSIDKHTADKSEMALLAVARYLESPVMYVAHVLHEATAGTGTKDDLLMAVLIGRSEIDLENVKIAYKDIHGKNLEDVVHSETSGDYRKLLIAILNPQS